MYITKLFKPNSEVSLHGANVVVTYPFFHIPQNVWYTNLDLNPFTSVTYPFTPLNLKPHHICIWAFFGILLFTTFKYL